MKKNYWDYFYKKKRAPIIASTFAKFVFKMIKDSKIKIYDIGCGNGRDTIFFNKKNVNCIGLDKSKQVIINNKKKFKKFKNNFLYKDFCNFFKNYKDGIFSVYSRFTWHSINYKDEQKLLLSLKKNKNLKFIYIEARTINDAIYGEGIKVGKHEFMTSHYRRFIDPKVLKKKLSTFMKIIYFKESKNLAKYKRENPCVMRILAKRK